MPRSHRADSSLARRHDNSFDYNDYDPCAREEHDAKSEFGQSTGSGFTILTDDTQPTSVSSNGSSEGSCGAHPGSFTDQLMKKLQSRGRMPSVSDGSPMRQLPSLPGESDAPLLPPPPPPPKDSDELGPPPPPPPPPPPGYLLLFWSSASPAASFSILPEGYCFCLKFCTQFSSSVNASWYKPQCSTFSSQRYAIYTKFMKQLQWDKPRTSRTARPFGKTKSLRKRREYSPKFNLMECGWKWRRISRPSS